MPEIINGKSSRWITTLLLKKKNHKDIEDIIKYYLKENIEVRPIWKPMHLQPFYKSRPFYHYSDKPLSKYFFEHGLCLPSGSGMSKSDMDKIISIFKKKTQ